MINITKIYLVTNCYGDPNKVYVGKTKNSRKTDHKKKYGNQIDYCYIDEINSIQFEDWEPLETFWIQYFKFIGFEVINKRKKGGSGSEFCSEETKLKISKGNKGKVRSQITRNKISKGNKGKIVSEDHKQRISNILKGKKKSKKHCENISKGNKGVSRNKNVPKPEGFGEMISRLRLGMKFSKETKRKISENKKDKGIKPIIQYDLNMNPIREWVSLKQAEEFFQPNKKADNIGATCRGKQKTAYGYVWKFKNN